jgi:UDP-GlcNAc:undecaprenyl-phosphate GlcNAc-1-phosphate transferase
VRGALTAFALGAAFALYTTPMMRAAALKFGIVDRPGGLKAHAEPVPYLGGLAVFLAFLITLGITSEFTRNVLGVLLAANIVLVVGLIDDLGVLSPLEKLAGQTIAIGVLLKAGIYVKLVFLPPGLDVVISVVWLLTMTNALNLLDVMDGLASGTAAIAALFFAAIATYNGQTTMAVLSAALAGSLVGFLRYNLAPARIYLGDAGSLFVGFLLGALAMNGAYTEKTWMGALTPAVILAVPLFELAFVSAIRLQKGVSPLRGSPDHFSYYLRRAGLSVPQVVGLSYGFAFVIGLAGLAVMQAAYEAMASFLVFAISASLLVAGMWIRRSDGS